MVIAMTNIGTVRSLVPERLRELGWTITKFSQETGLAYGTANAWAKGYVDRMDLATLAAICKALSVQPGDILVYIPEDTET
jgi:DNA-binding Xre family transcriptional regulator